MVALCTIFQSRAEGVPYFKGTVYEALSEAQRQQKMLMVEFYASWNYKSRWMTENIIARKDVYTVIDQTFVLVRVDTKTKEGADLAVQYQVVDYPSIVIFNQNGTVIDKIDQTMDRHDFLARMAQIRLENDGKSGWELRKIFIAAQKDDKTEADKLTKEYLARLDKKNIISPVHWELFTNSTITYYDSSAFDYLLKNRADFDTVFSKIAVDELVDKTYVEAILPYAIGAYEFDSLFVDNFIQSTPPNTVASNLALMSQYRFEKNLDKYIEIVNVLIDSVEEHIVPRLVLSLEYVAEYGTTNQKRTARHMVEKFGRSTTSASELLLIDALTKKLSE